MLYAVVFAVFVTLFTFWILFPRRVVHLSKFSLRMFPDKIFVRLNREISIFNKMKIKLPKTRGNADLYIKWLGRLHVNPKEKYVGDDPVEKLLYIYACARLYKMTRDSIVMRQLYKNILYSFIGKRHARFSFKPYKMSKRRVYAIRQPLFKYMHTRFVPRQDNLRAGYSYMTEKCTGASIKTYTAFLKGDKTPIECQHIVGNHRFVRTLSQDKMKSTISHTADTFYCVDKNVCTAVFVADTKRVNFETSLAEQVGVLNVYVKIKDGARIFTIQTRTKGEAQNVIAKIKQQGSPRYLQTPEQIAHTTAIENLFERAYLSKFTSGEKLFKRMLCASEIVPTIHLPTIVYDITDGEELFPIIDDFDKFHAIAQAGHSLNIVIIYSSQNDVAREFIANYTSQTKATDLINHGVFIFFVDKVRASNDVIYYFSKMFKASQDRIRNITHDQNAKLYIVSRKNVSYSITDPRTSITKYHRIAPGIDVLDSHGNVIPVGKDAVVTSIVTKKQVIKQPRKTSDARAV